MNNSNNNSNYILYNNIVDNFNVIINIKSSSSLIGLSICIVIITWVSIKIYAYRKRLLQYPLKSPSNIIENIKNLKYEDIRKIDHMVYLFKLMGNIFIKIGKSNSTGLTFRHTLSLFRIVIYTNDYKLAKILQSGKDEAEKCSNLKVFNVIDRDSNSIISHQNKNVDREHARKALAPSFASSNLFFSWNNLKLILKEHMENLSIQASSFSLSSAASLSSSSSDQLPFDIKPMISKMILSYLAKSGLDMKFNFDGTEDDNSVDGYKWIDGMLLLLVI